jgi:hypothetical protein
MVKCNACGGTYEPILADKTQYFHACPPLSGAELRDQLAKKAIQLSPAQQKQLDDATAADKSNPVPDGERTRAELALAMIVVERPNRRDENVVGAGAPGEPAPIKASGAGVTKI